MGNYSKNGHCRRLSLNGARSQSTCLKLDSAPYSIQSFQAGCKLKLLISRKTRKIQLITANISKAKPNLKEKQSTLQCNISASKLMTFKNFPSCEFQMKRGKLLKKKLRPFCFMPTNGKKTWQAVLAATGQRSS